MKGLSKTLFFGAIALIVVIVVTLYFFWFTMIGGFGF